MIRSMCILLYGRGVPFSGGASTERALTAKGLIKDKISKFRRKDGDFDSTSSSQGRAFASVF